MNIFKNTFFYRTSPVAASEKCVSEERLIEEVQIRKGHGPRATVAFNKEIEGFKVFDGGTSFTFKEFILLS